MVLMLRFTLFALLEVFIDANRIRSQSRLGLSDGAMNTDFLASASLVTQSGEIAPPNILEDKVVAMYFSAHWCGPCRQFTPALKRFYENLKSAGENIEIVFISLDGSAAEFAEYFHNDHGDWLALQYGSPAKDSLAQRYQVRGIPTLIVVDSKGKSVVPNAIGDVSGATSKAVMVSIFAKWKKLAHNVEEHNTGLHPGNYVQISGVTSRTDLNGLLATCEHWLADRGRWSVKLQSGEFVALKPANLKLVEVKEEETGFQQGDPVLITGLKSKASVNGQHGTCEQWIADRARWRIKLLSGADIYVRPVNLASVEASSIGGPLASTSFVTQAGETATTDAVEGKVVAIYFSAHWCGPCRHFTPALRQFYQTLKTQGENIEIVFVSLDHSEGDFEEYFHNDHGDWLAVQYGSSARENLAHTYQVRGIPTLIVVDSQGVSRVPNAISDVASANSQDSIMYEFATWKKLAGDWR